MPTQAVFFDLDNTLYDWTGYFASAIRETISRLHELSGVAEDILLREARGVFREHGSVEYGFWIQELPSIQSFNEGRSGHQIAKRYWPAIEAFKGLRRELLAPYPGVIEGLTEIRTNGVTTVALTDATHWHAEHRLDALGLSTLFDYLIARPDIPIPSHTDLREVSSSALLGEPPARFLELPTSWRKPDPRIISHACAALAIETQDSAMVGDSLTSDVQMAKWAGAVDIWAAYGSVIRQDDMDILKSVSNWPAARISEMQTAGSGVSAPTPTHIARSFGDVTRFVLP